MQSLTAVQVTNPNVYSVPDIDSESESDIETDILHFSPKPVSICYNKNLNIGKALESAMYTEIHVKSNQKRKVDSIKHKDIYQKLNQKVKDARQRILEEDRERRERESKDIEKIRSSIKKVSLFDQDDSAFEEEMKLWDQKVEAAIKNDRNKRETELAAEKERAEIEQKKKKEEEEKTRAEKEKAEKELKLKISQAYSPDGLEEYEKHYKKLDYFKKNLKPKLTTDAVFRKQIFETKRLVKRTIAQLQYKHEVIFEKYSIMYNHLESVKGQSREAFEVLLNFLSKAFLEQVKQEVHATAFAAYFLARFAYLLISTIPELTDYLFGRLFKRCPYLIPQYHDDDPSIPGDEIKRRLRYNYTNKDTKTLQNFLQHAEEQKCYIMFYGALCQTEPSPGQPSNPYPIKHAWIWLARISNMPPREITPILVMGMLEVSAKKLLKAYPTQTPKLLKLIQSTILSKYPKRDGNDNLAGIKRLEMFLDDYLKKGKLNCIEESMAPSKA